MTLINQQDLSPKVKEVKDSRDCEDNLLGCEIDSDSCEDIGCNNLSLYSVDMRQDDEAIVHQDF